MVKRVALVGASSTGKTTVYELLKNKLPKWEFVNESTRIVNSYGFPINEIGINETQLAISSFHLKSLLIPNNLILDRCFLDLLIYTTELKNVSENTTRYISDIWKDVFKEYTHFVYFPIEFDAVNDGQRSTNEEWRRKVDTRFSSFFLSTDTNYIKVTGSPMQRVDQILKFIKE